MIDSLGSGENDVRDAVTNGVDEIKKRR